MANLWLVHAFSLFLRWAVSAPAVSDEPSPTAAARCRGRSCWTRRGWVCTSALSATWPTRSCPARRIVAGTSIRTACAPRLSSLPSSPSSRWDLGSVTSQIPDAALREECLFCFSYWNMRCCPLELTFNILFHIDLCPSHRPPLCGFSVFCHMCRRHQWAGA